MGELCFNYVSFRAFLSSLYDAYFFTFLIPLFDLERRTNSIKFGIRKEKRTRNGVMHHFIRL